MDALIAVSKHSKILYLTEGVPGRFNSSKHTHFIF